MSVALWPASIRWRMPSPPAALERLGVAPDAIRQGHRANRVARPAGARVRRSRDHPGWRAQSRRRARPGRLHRALLRSRPRVADLRRHARQGRRGNRGHPVSARPPRDRDRAAAGPRAAPRNHPRSGRSRFHPGRPRHSGCAGDGSGSRPGDAIFVTGSLFLVGEARALLARDAILQGRHVPEPPARLPAHRSLDYAGHRHLRDRSRCSLPHSIRAAARSTRWPACGRASCWRSAARGRASKASKSCRPAPVTCWWPII